MENIKIGSIGEEYAVNYLKNQGYKIIDRNFKCNIGEIDIIAVRGSTISFIEVKTRRTVTYGYPLDAIDNKKRNKLKKLTEYYINKNNVSKYTIRMEAIGIIIKPQGGFLLNQTIID